MGVVKELPWVEKYRPKKLSDVIFQTNAVSIMEQVIETFNMPHMIFHGPPGTGKTSAALAMARQIYGLEGMRERVLELNASDERGIDVVRDRIKTYTRINISTNKVNPETNRVMPNYKIIILDEADMITPDAQAALRRVIENYSNISRFILICNYLHKIIGPIYSRCSVFHFKPIDTSSQVQRLEYICTKEGVNYQKEALEFLTKVSSGDMRKSITILQSTASLYNEITEEAIYSVSGQPPKEVVEKIFKECSKPDGNVEKVCRNIIHDGWDVSAIFEQICDYVVNSDSISDLNKSKISLELANRDYALLQGGSQYFQLASACFHIRTTIAGDDSYSPNTKVKWIKEKLLESETFKECNIRVIYRGLLLSDEKILSNLPGFSDNELILTVFITKPNKPAPTNNTNRNDLWKWSTSAWIAIIATLWCYKFKFKQSFKNFSVLILYIMTFFCFKTLFSRLIRGNRARTPPANS